MRNLGTSLVLAITLLTAGAQVAPANCCDSKGSGEQSVRAVDCCDSIVDCPQTPEAGRLAVVSSGTPMDAAMALPGDEPGTAAPDRHVTRLASDQALAFKPPLYRLHSQLLI